MATLLFAVVLLQAQPVQADRDKTDMTNDISIKVRGSGGPPVELPSPAAEKAIVDEVIDSLNISKAPAAGAPATAKLPGGSSRLERPFPAAPFLTLSPRSVTAPYDQWTFEVFEGSELVWRQSGTGGLAEKIEWDGSGQAGDLVARVERSYHYRFTGSGRSSFIVTSEPVRLKSMYYKEYVGDQHLELSNEVLFQKGSAKFGKDAAGYLAALAERMRRAPLREQSYKLLLYSSEPRGKLAAARAAAMRRRLAKDLLINLKKVDVDTLSVGPRGDTTVCVLPAETGDTIRVE